MTSVRGLVVAVLYFYSSNDRYLRVVTRHELVRDLQPHDGSIMLEIGLPRHS